MNDAADVDNRYKYNGKEYQSEHGLNWYAYGARYYDPMVGRFTRVDALAGDPNQIDKSPLAYAWNNPVKLNDPDGNCPKCVKAIAKTLIKSAIKGKVDLGEVYDLGDASATLFSKDASFGERALAVFDVLSPVSSKELKAGAKLLGIADNAGDANKAAKKVTSVAYQTAASRGDTQAWGRPEMSSCSTSMGPRVAKTVPALNRGPPDQRVSLRANPGSN